MLFARRNQAFVDDEEQSKKIVFERTLKWVKRLYPEENKEVALTPVKISSQLQYGYDSLFESFRSAVEQVLSASYDGELASQKSYEIIRKYNQLSSFLKNILNMNQATPDDEARIKKDFDSMKDKLTALKNLAVANNFHDEKDIVFMVDKINETTSIQKSQYGNVPSQPSSDIARKVEDKTTLQGKLKLLGTQIPDMQQKLKLTATPERENVIKLNKKTQGSN